MHCWFTKAGDVFGKGTLEERYGDAIDDTSKIDVGKRIASRATRLAARVVNLTAQTLCVRVYGARSSLSVQRESPSLFLYVRVFCKANDTRSRPARPLAHMACWSFELRMFMRSPHEGHQRVANINLFAFLCERIEILARYFLLNTFVAISFSCV